MVDLKEIIKSVEFVNADHVDESMFELKFMLYPDPASKFFEEVQNAIDCELLPGADTDKLFPYPNKGQASSIFVRGIQLWIYDYDMNVNHDGGWYSLWTKDETIFSLYFDVTKQEWSIIADFEKRKDGVDKFDYTDYNSLPELFWIEPARMIRQIFS